GRAGTSGARRAAPRSPGRPRRAAPADTPQPWARAWGWGWGNRGPGGGGAGGEVGGRGGGGWGGGELWYVSVGVVVGVLGLADAVLEPGHRDPVHAHV